MKHQIHILRVTDDINHSGKRRWFIVGNDGMIHRFSPKVNRRKAVETYCNRMLTSPNNLDIIGYNSAFSMAEAAMTIPGIQYRIRGAK